MLMLTCVLETPAKLVAKNAIFKTFLQKTLIKRLLYALYKREIFLLDL